MTCVTSFLPKN